MGCICLSKRDKANFTETFFVDESAPWSMLNYRHDKLTLKMDRRNFPRTMSLSCVTTPELKDYVMDDATQDDDTKPHYLKSMSKYTIVLIDFQQFPEDFKKILKGNILDTSMQHEMESQGIINWCRTVKPLFPLKTRGDGNCLLHAVSLAMWGIHDSSAFLRRLVLVALVNDGQCGGGKLRERWQKSRICFNQSVIHGGIQFDTQEWETEWHQVLTAASDVKKPLAPNQHPYDFLEDIHIFVLTNILRRPIIILGDSVIHSPNGSPISENHFPGIYLPLLWRSNVCVKTPIVLGYGNSHFVPLLGVEDGPDIMNKLVPENVVPLVTKKLENLVLHFLDDKEEKYGGELLNKYLNVMDINWTRKDSVQFVPCAKLKYERLQQFDLVKDHALHLQKLFLDYNRNSEQNKDTFKQLENVSSKPLLNDETLNFNVAEKPKTVQLKKKLIDVESSESDSDDKPLNIEHFEKDKLPINDYTSLEHNCEHNKCPFLVTARSYPYCMAHRRRRSNSASYDDTLHLDENMEKVALDDEKVNRNSINGKHSHFNGTSQPCKTTGCNMYGLHEWGYMCSSHRRLQKTSPSNSQIPLESNEFSSNHWQKCRSPKKVCKSHGEARYGGQCKDCFVCEGKNRYETKKCIKPGCEFYGIADYNYYCSKCVLDYINVEQQNLGEIKRLKEVNVDDRSKMNSMDILALLPGRSPAEMKHAREFYKCLFHDCRQLATESTLGFCIHHFLQMYRIGKVNIPTEEEVAQFKQEIRDKRSKSSSSKPGTELFGPSTSGQQQKTTGVKQEITDNSKQGNKQTVTDENRCCRSGCHGIRCKNKFNLCYFCYDIMKHGKESKFNEESCNERKHGKRQIREEDIIESAAPETENSFSSDICKGPSCTRKGKDILKGLCEECHAILSQTHAAKMQDKPIHPEIMIHPATNLVAPTPAKIYSQKCKTRGCNMYGTEPHMGYCSKCFTQSTGEILQQQQRQIREQERLRRLNMMTEAEVMNQLPLDRKIGYPSKCLTPECDLYGDAVFRGFCSKCAEKKGMLSPPMLRTTAQINVAPQMEPHCRMPVERGYEDTAVATEHQCQETSESEDLTGYKRAMLQVEKQNRSHQRCNTSRCENYGSPKHQGYCSSCYSKFFGEKS